jgi:hypothetical protein
MPPVMSPIFPSLAATGNARESNIGGSLKQQAKTAAASMMRLERPFKAIPYFWTYHYGVRYEFFGQISEGMELFVDGGLEQSKFIAAYLVGGQCEAFFAANREKVTALLLDRMRVEGSPSFETFQEILKTD